MSFVRDDLGYTTTGAYIPEEKELALVWSEYFLAIDKVRKLAITMSSRVGQQVTTADLG